MLHDITHCDNENCPKKDNCYRYLAHLEAKEQKLPYVSYFLWSDYPMEDDSSCDKFWNAEEFKSRLSNFEK